MPAVYLLFVVAVSALLSWPLGRYLAWAMDARHDHGLAAALGRACERMLGLGRPAVAASWRGYFGAMLLVNGIAFVVAFLLLCCQAWLPWNPDHRPAIGLDLAFHTAASFVTNTDQQHYAGEATMSHLSQVAALMWLQFMSAATGLAALTALARALAGRSPGDFCRDALRAIVFVLLPLATPLALGLAAAGVPMTLDGAVTATTLEGATQTISRGPVAAFLAIKQLGTNGGGFFGANSAHPFENPGFWTDTVTLVAILVLPMACVWLFGRIVGDRRHAATLFAVMLVLLLGKATFAIATEHAPTVAFRGLPIAADVGNLEGKELRFGATAAPLWAVATTATSNGSVDCMHDSLAPLTGLAPLAGMWLNATFGGVGVGMVNMVLYAVLAAFLAGMMVGRTPEYLQRRIEVREVRCAVLALLTHALLILVGTALFAGTDLGRSTVADRGPHGFTEILYEFSSAAANNGSGFEGLGDGTVAWNLATGLVILLGRYLPIALPLALAASLGKKRITARSAGTLGTANPTFAIMLLGTIVFLGALTFLPAAALGPLAEHLQTGR